MNKSANEMLEIQNIIQNYFDGLHYGNVDKLRAIFDPQVILFAPSIRRKLDDWLMLVAKRDVPAKLGDKERYKIIAIDITGEQAMAKVECPLLSQNYIDHLGFLKENGCWKIVSKMYSAFTTYAQVTEYQS